jgi:hypothetical protein
MLKICREELRISHTRKSLCGLPWDRVLWPETGKVSSGKTSWKLASLEAPWKLTAQQT